jgi:hypothetical protein
LELQSLGTISHPLATFQMAITNPMLQKIVPFHLLRLWGWEMAQRKSTPKRILGVSWYVFTSIRPRWPEIDSPSALQSTLQATQKNQKGKKGKKKDNAPDSGDPSVSFASGPPPGEGSDGEAAAAKGDISAPKTGVAVTAEDLADDEWGPVKEKGKKGKGKKSKAEDEDEDATAGAC